MMIKPVTLDQVARAAKLSPAAVSRYLNGTLSLPAATRSRIERAVRELGYRPNSHARSLSRGRSDAIGLVIPEIDNPFFSRLAAATERAADARGIAIMLCSTSNKVSREVNYVEKLDASLVDGLLFATNHHDADGALAAAINRATRVVLVDEDVPGTNVPKVFSDNVQGGYLAGRHFVEAGHRRLAYIGGPRDLMSAKERAEGFRQAVRDSGTDAAVVEELYGGYQPEHGAEAISDILARRPEITAVFVGSDAILVGVLRVLASRSITVGGYVSVVTFDDASPLELLATPVTAIRQSIDAMGEGALALMLAAIEGGAAPRTERLPVELVIRRSVRFLG
jgi:LacI family transcriptional regulator